MKVIVPNASKRKAPNRKAASERPAQEAPAGSAAAPRIGPTEVEMARVMLPAAQRAVACLNLAVAIAEQGEDGPLLGSFELNWQCFEAQYLAAIEAYRKLVATFPTAGNA